MGIEIKAAAKSRSIILLSALGLVIGGASAMGLIVGVMASLISLNIIGLALYIVLYVVMLCGVGPKIAKKILKKHITNEKML